MSCEKGSIVTSTKTVSPPTLELNIAPSTKKFNSAASRCRALRHITEVFMTWAQWSSGYKALPLQKLPEALANISIRATMAENRKYPATQTPM
jgi:hypothetical protein